MTAGVFWVAEGGEEEDFFGEGGRVREIVESVGQRGEKRNEELGIRTTAKEERWLLQRGRREGMKPRLPPTHFSRKGNAIVHTQAAPFFAFPAPQIM